MSCGSDVASVNPTFRGSEEPKARQPRTPVATTNTAAAAIQRWMCSAMLVRPPGRRFENSQDEVILHAALHPGRRDTLYGD